MTVTVTNAYSAGTGNGAAKIFPFTFRCQDPAAVKVFLNGVVQTIGFTVIVNANGVGGSVVFDVAPANGVKVLIESDPSFEQLSQFGDSGPYLGSAHDIVNDAAAIRDIRLKADVDRALKLAPGNIAADMPDISQLVGKFLTFDVNGNPIGSSGTGADAGLRTDLGANSGASLVTILASATAGAIARSLQSYIRSGDIYPEDFGAVGDGATDDTTALNNARAAAVAAGKWLDGRGRTYGYTGAFNGVSNLWARNFTLKQLAPGANNGVRTIDYSGLDNVKLVNVKVNRNGDGTNGGFAQSTGVNGCLDTAYGMKFYNCTNSLFMDLEVTGADTGTGILFMNLDKTCSVVRPWAHNLTGINPIATDENIQGMEFKFCTGLTIVAPRSHNHLLTYNAGANTDRQYTRGISYSGCTGLTVIGPQIDQVGEGHDVSSSNENSEIVILGGQTSNCWNWGVKLANLVRRSRVIGHIATNCNGAGFVDSSGFDTQPAMRDANVVENCVARDCGDPATYSQACGFAALVSTHTYTNGVIFRNCVAIDKRGTALMKYGYHNEKVASSYCQTSFEGSESSGHTVAPFDGEHENRCHVTLNSASQAIPADGAAHEITWDTELEDTADLHSNSVSPGRVTIKRDGVYLVLAQVYWTGSATGIRQLYIQKNGATIVGSIDEVPGQAVNHTQKLQWITIRLKAGDTLGVAVQQNSGGALNVIANGNKTGLIVQRMTA